MSTTRDYDPACHDLALHFLEAEEMAAPVMKKAAARLADYIQQEIESFMENDLRELLAEHAQELRDRDDYAKEEAAIAKREEGRNA